MALVAAAANPATPSLRGLACVLRSCTWTGLRAPTDAPVPTATCPTDSFQLSPASVEAQVPGSSSGGGVAIRPPTIRCFGRSMRMISAANGEAASDFSNLRQNGLVRITFPLPPEHQAHRSGDQRPSSGTPKSTCGGAVPDRERRRPHRDRTTAFMWPSGRTQRARWLPAGRARRDAAGAGARPRSPITRRSVDAPPQRLLDDLVVVPAGAVHEPAGRARLSDAPCGDGRDRCPIPTATAPIRSNSRARSCSSAPARSATAGPGQCDAAGDAAGSSCTGDSISQHLQPVSAPGRHRSHRALRVRSRVRRNSRATCAPHEIALSVRDAEPWRDCSRPGTSFAGPAPIPVVRW